jgi:hypothetical protein
MLGDGEGGESAEELQAALTAALKHRRSLTPRPHVACVAHTLRGSPPHTTHSQAAVEASAFELYLHAPK